MEQNKKGCFSRIWCVVQILLKALDVFTDCSTLIVYWNDASMTVFVLALLSLIVSFPVGVATFFYHIKLCTGKIDSERPIITLKLIGILLESLPQLMLNLHVLSVCDQGADLIQWVSAGLSFLSICVAIFHYDISVRVHKDIGPIQKIFILFYRSSYLAGRMLAMLYFVSTLRWWLALVMIVHWLIGLCVIMRNRDETAARSVAIVFLNTFVYIGEFAGVTVLFILMIYAMENLMMTTAAYIVMSQSDLVLQTTATTVTTLWQLTTPEWVARNDFQAVESIGNETDGTVQSRPEFTEPCVDFGILSVHIGLNVFAIVMCCLYNVSFHYTFCVRDPVSKHQPDHDIEEELRAEFHPTDENA